MNTKISRKKIRIRTYVTALIICLGISTLVLYMKSSSYEYELRARQQSAVTELTEYVDSISTELNRGVYANSSPMMSRVATTLSRNCAGAKAALSEISAPNTFLQNTYRFLSQVGDFTQTLNSKIQNGTPLTDEERSLLFSLLDYSKKLSDSISRLVSEYEVETDLKLQTEGISTALSDIEQSFEGYPSLIYDGPFSDHINMEDAEMLNELFEIDKDSARTLAAKYTGIEEKNLLLGEEEIGSFPCYTFSTESTSISITQKGGLLCTMLTMNRAGEVAITYKDAIKCGLKYLEEIGYSNMTDTYYSVDDGSCTINYAFKIGDIICYTDLIKVTVSLDNGRILSVDARGYIMNHQERTLTPPSITKEEAMTKLSKDLTVKSVKSAVIPSASDKEYYCYEFLCTGKNKEDILVYIDTTTGVEDDILLLLYADGGTLTK